MTVGERIKQRRKELGMTQDELARKMGYNNKSSICSVETNREKNMSLERVEKFAKILDTSAAFLMFGETERIITPINSMSEQELFQDMSSRVDEFEMTAEVIERFGKLPIEGKRAILRILDTWGIK